MSTNELQVHEVPHSVLILAKFYPLASCRTFWTGNSEGLDFEMSIGGCLKFSLCLLTSKLRLMHLGGGGMGSGLKTLAV